MATSGVKWNGSAFEAGIRREMVKRLHVAGTIVRDRARVLLSVAGSGRVKGRKSGPVVRSKPGEPPRKQDGFLRGRVTYKIENGMVCKVGTPVWYGYYLEVGTSRIVARPWLRRAFAERRAMVRRVMGIKF